MPKCGNAVKHNRHDRLIYVNWF